MDRLRSFLLAAAATAAIISLVAVWLGDDRLRDISVIALLVLIVAALHVSSARVLQALRTLTDRLRRETAGKAKPAPDEKKAARELDKQLGKLASAMETIQTSLERQGQLAKRASDKTDKTLTLVRGAVHLYDDINIQTLVPELATAQDGRPVIIGPWTMEVGYELLYWVPFVRHVLRAYGIGKEQVTVISRGGVASWYSDIADNYVELFDRLGEDGFRQFNSTFEAENRSKKAYAPYQPETDFLTGLAAERGLAEPVLFPPYIMNRLFRAAWSGRGIAEAVLPHLAFEPVVPDNTLLQGMPFTEGFTAIKYYHSDCFPETESNRRFVRETISRLASEGPVVVLSLPTSVDDHYDAAIPEGDNIFVATGLLAPRNNLGVQTAIVGAATKLYCTYGGFSYLGMLTGTPTETVTSNPNYLGLHLDLAMKAPASSNTQEFTVKRLSAS